MTLAAVIPDIAFVGTSSPGSLGPYSLVKSGTPIVFYNNSEILVYRYDTVTDEVPLLLVEGTDYTLTGGPVAGSITLTSPSTGLLATERLYAVRRSVLSQALDLVHGGNFSSANLERRLDVVETKLQEHARDIRSTVRFSMFDTDEIPGTVPLHRAIDRIAYIGGTASNPLLEFINVNDLGAGPSLTEAQMEDVAIVASDLGGADTIGIVATDLAGDDDIGAVADWLAIGGGVGGNAVSTYAALTAITAENRSDDMLVYVGSRTADGDGGDGFWRFDSASSATANGGTILAPDVGTGRWIRQTGGEYHVDWFGAGSGDASAQTAAVKRLRDLLNDSVVLNAEIQWGPRNYQINELIAFEGDQISMKGAGRNATRIILTAATGLFEFDVLNADTNGTASVDVHDMTLLAGIADAGTAIKINGPVLPGTDVAHFERVSIQNVSIGSLTQASHNFTRGIWTDSVSNITILNCIVTGRFQDKTKLLDALRFSGNNFASQIYLTNTDVIWASTSVRVSASSTFGQGIEGVHIIACNFVAVQVGVNWQGGGEPHLLIDGCHMAYDVIAVQMTNPFDSQIINSLFYYVGPASSSTCINLVGTTTQGRNLVISGNHFSDIRVALGDPPGSIAISILNMEAVIITNNVFQWWNTGIRMMTPTGGLATRNSIIGGNIYHDGVTAVNMEASTTGIIVRNDQVYKSMTNRVIDAGTNFVEQPSLVYQVVTTVAGGAPFEYVNLAIPSGLLNAKPLSATIDAVAGANVVLCVYLYDDAASTATNLRVLVHGLDGANIIAGAIRYSIRIN